MRIGLLECDHVDDRLRAIDGDYADMFAALLDIELVPYDAVNGALPASPDECDGWLAGGSRFSVYDDSAWIGALSDFVRDIQRSGAPYVGICFGHQLLAHSVGGRTEKATGWGVGAIDTRIDATQSDALLLYMHQDQVVALPDDSRVLGRADHCPVAMLQVGKHMLGVQAHPEFSPAYVDALLDAREERIGAELTAHAKASLKRVADRKDSEVLGHWIVRFLEAVTE